MNSLPKKITINDFPKICRICLLAKPNMANIHLQNLTDRLRCCTGIRVRKDDKLPMHICESCLEQTYQLYKFRLLARSSAATLNVLLKEDAKNRRISKVESDVERPAVQDDTKSTLDTQVEPFTTTESDNGNVFDQIKLEPYRLEDNASIKRETSKSNKTNATDCDRKDIKSAQQRRIEKLQKRLGKERTQSRIENSSYRCLTCRRSFSSKSQLEQHVPTHNSSQCPTCHKQFPRLSILRKHEIIHKKDRQIHYCPVCNASFYGIYSFRKHMANHSDAPIVKEICSICGKAVKCLKAHMITVHTKTRPHQCEQCGKGFLYRNFLVTHVKTAHLGIPKEKKSMCSECGMAFVSEVYLRRHMHVHSEERNFACHLCERKYKKQTSLQIHLQVHANIRPHVCEQCKKAFLTRTMLKIHLRTHTGERPYACQVCGSAYKYSYALKTHMKVHGRRVHEGHEST